MTKKAVKKGGPKPRKIDYKVLDALCAIQCTGEECAAALSMDYDTLNAALKRDGNVGFSDYFGKKSANGKVSLRRRQFKIAEEGNPTMLIWLGKQWLGQSEKHDSNKDLTSPPLDINISVKEAKSDVTVTKGKEKQSD